MKQITAQIWEKVKALNWRQIGWYGAVAGVLVVLGIGSRGYRRQELPAPAPTPVAAMAAATPDPLAALAVLPTPSPTPAPAYQWPLDGEIIGEYAGDHPVWCAGLEQWQTHPALDLAAAAGEAVVACADGVITDAWQDHLWGNVVEITHPDGGVSRYANLSTLKLATVGEKVAAGQVIGAVGQTAVCECDMPWHLHFSYQKGGEFVNFEEIVSKNPF